MIVAYLSERVIFICSSLSTNTLISASLVLSSIKLSFFCWKFDLYTDSQIDYSGSLLKLVNAFKEFMPNSKKEKAKNLIGYYKIKDYTKGYDSRDREFSGVCHGLAVSSIADFNNKNEALGWGNDLSLSKSKDEIVSIFQKHWKDRDSELARPFSKNVHSYDASNNMRDAFHSLGKIGYYFLSQSSYSGTEKDPAEAWVGKHQLIELDYITRMNTFHQKFLKNNKVSLFSFDIKEKDGTNVGHSIIATEFIKYNEHSLYALHDNNKVDTLTMLDFNNNFNLETFIAEYDIVEDWRRHPENYEFQDGKKHYFKVTSYDSFKDFENVDWYESKNYYGFDTFSEETDELHIYGKSNNVNKQQKVSKQTLQKVNNDTFAYLYPNHISITIVGGKLVKITDTQTQKEILLNPIAGQLEQNKAYLKDNMLITKFLLPKSSIYKIELQKYKQYPAFEVYAKIPTDDGKVEIINYENLATNQDDSTLAHFLVGNGNSEKVIKREGESDVAPTYDEAIDIKLTSVVSINAIVLENGVKLSWQNSIHPNYEESVVIRKENSMPISTADGTEVYRGTDEEFLDTTVANEKKYYYAVSKDNKPTEPVWTMVDTYRYTLYGTLSDASNEPINGTTVTLHNGTKTRLIDTGFSSQNGLFSFNNLLDGEYVLNFSHPYYTFEKSELNVIVEKKSKEVLMKAEGLANLFMDIPQAVKVGESQTIIWDGVHIDDSATVNIKLFRDEKWETVASSVPYNQHSYKWNVTAPKGEAKLRVELDDVTFVEKDIFIFGSDELKYDFDGDGDIDIDDIMVVVGGWTAHVGDAKFKSEYDYNSDGVIDIKDIMKIASQWGM